MATYSQYLGLKLNAPSDPFQLTDFITNWGILDASPGIFICTSSSRPAWTAPQAGRLIFMTDLKQLSYFDGAAWNDLRDSAPTFFSSIAPNAAMSPGTNATYSICTFTTPRPCSLAMWYTFTHYVAPNANNGGATQGVSYIPTIDGTQVTMAFTPHNTCLQWDNTVTNFVMIPSVTAGQHTLGAALFVDNGYHNPVYIHGLAAMGMISLYSSLNTL